MKPPRLSAPPAVRWIARTLEEAGFETWAVGGAVRDALMGHPSDDWDLATRATPVEVRRIFRRTVPLGVEHGTVGVLADDNTLFEVTTFRLDVETDGRHAVVAFADTVEEDLARRDFTINAMAWHPLRDELLDPFGGAGDLEAGVLRAVGVAADRFAEDYLRILRAFRFAGRFSLTLHEETWRAACGGAEHLRALSAERIREELLKVLDADRAPSGALELYRGSGALQVLYPELQALHGRNPSAWDAALRSVDHLSIGRPFVRLAALLRGLPAGEAAALLVRLRLSNAQTDEVALRAGAPPLPDPSSPDAELRRWLSAVGPSRLAAVGLLELARARTGTGRSPEDVVVAWRRCRGILATRPPLALGDLALDGRDLIRMGLRPGPRFATILQHLLEWVLEDPERNRKATLEARVTDLLEQGLVG